MPVSPRTRAKQNVYYYVAVHDGERSALLAGPYIAEPSNEVRDRVRERAYADDWRAWFYVFSLGRSASSSTPRYGRV